jgi:hypothetical protein
MPRCKKDAKMPNGQKMPVPLKEMPIIPRCQNQKKTEVTSEISHDAVFRN